MYEDLIEKKVSRKEIYDGRVLHVVADKIILPSGEESVREFCIHVGAVAVIPVLSDGRVIMERQYRYAHSRVFYEIPAGKLDSVDEDPLSAAMRELREETGAIAGRMTSLGIIDTSPALINERIHLYLAEDLHFAERELDEDEFLDVVKVPFGEVVKMIMENKIPDAKTQTAVLKAKILLGK